MALDRMGDVRWGPIKVGPVLRRALVLLAVAGIAAAISCSLLTHPSDYTGSAPPDAGPGLPEDVLARVFVLGGVRDGIEGFDDATVDVWVADIALDGTLRPWRSTTPTLHGGTFGATAFVDKLFALGRSAEIDSYDRLFVMAAPLAGGGVAGWSGAADENGNGNAGINVTLYQGYAYVVGGAYTYEDDAGVHTGYENDVLVSKLDPEAAALAGWTTGEPLVFGRHNSGVLAHAGHLFVVAGEAGGRMAQVELAAIDPNDGSVGPFSEQPPLGDATEDGGVDPFLVRGPAVCAGSEYVYVVGGDHETGPSDVVMRSRFDASNEELSAWSREAKLPVGLDGTACVVIGERIYVLGGAALSSRKDEVWVGNIGADGAVASWHAELNRLPSGRSHFAVAVLTTSP